MVAFIKQPYMVDYSGINHIWLIRDHKNNHIHQKRNHIFNHIWLILGNVWPEIVRHLKQKYSLKATDFANKNRI